MTAHDGKTPVSASEALRRLSVVANDPRSQYRLGSGDYTVGSHATPRDVPWTADKHGIVGCDCAGALVYAYELHRHSPGFNHPTHPTSYWDILDIVDDINTNSMIGDARGNQQLFIEISRGDQVLAGDMLVYPTIRLPNHDKTDWLRRDDGSVLEWIGHGQLVGTPRNVRSGGPYSDASVLQCYGGQNRTPAIRMTDASAMDHHDHIWEKPEHRTAVLRIHPRFSKP